MKKYPTWDEKQKMSNLTNANRRFVVDSAIDFRIYFKYCVCCQSGVREWN